MESVTNLISLLNKPGLINWANKIGLNGVSLSEFSSQSTKSGSSKHKEIEVFLSQGVEFSDSEKLKKLIRDFDIIGVEKYISNGFIHGYCDLILKKGDNIIIVDFKPKDKIYLSEKLQLSTYKEIFKANKIAIINYNNWRLNYVDINTLKYYEIIKRLYQIKKLLKSLNERL